MRSFVAIGLMIVATSECGSDAGSGVDLGADLAAPVPDLPRIIVPDIGSCPSFAPLAAFPTPTALASS